MKPRRHFGRTHVRHLVCCVVSFFACWLSTPTFAQDWAYTLRPGDDLWSVARQFCGRASAAEKIAKHNSIADPATLLAGERINIPIKLLVFEPAAAKVFETSGVVTLARSSARTAQRVPARPGDVLRMGNELITEDGFAVVEFADGSQLSLAPQSRVLFNKLTRFGPAGMIDTHLRFTYGRGRAVVQPQNRGDRFRISTPGGIAAVRGTEFRVGHTIVSEEPVSTAETLEGKIQFDHTDAAYELPAGFGVSVSAQGAKREALLPAPKWLETQISATVGEQINWAPVAGAEAYIVSWLADDASQSIIAQTRTVQPWTPVDVHIGDYLLAVRAVSPSGIEGIDTQRSLAVRALAPQALHVSTSAGEPTTLAWTYPDPQAKFSLALQGPGENQSIQITGLSTSLTLAPGQYRWEVKALDSAMSQSHTFSVKPRPIAALELERQQRTIIASWANEHDANASYEIELRHLQDTTASERIVSQATTATFEASRYGTYEIMVTTVVNGERSEPRTEEISIQRRPWWLLGIPLLLLL